MKKYLLIILTILINSSLFAQVPNTISWQGMIQDIDGNDLDGSYNITVKLYDVGTGGTAVWTETQNSVTIINGVANLSLGSVTPFNLRFDKQYWLEITVGNGTPLPRIKLASVPYSLYSAKTSSVIQNDSLVLKDAQGVTRMVLNPNTGTFKMMNNDTVWYSLNVNSPLEEEIRKNQNMTSKTYTNNGIEVTEHYNKSTNQLMYKQESNYDPLASPPYNDSKTTIYHYDQNGKIVTKEESKYYGATGSSDSETLYYDSNGMLIKKLVQINHGIGSTTPGLVEEKLYVLGVLKYHTKKNELFGNYTSINPTYGETWSSYSENTFDGWSQKHSSQDKWYNIIYNNSGLGGYKVGVGVDKETISNGFTFDKFGGVYVYTANGYAFYVQGNISVNGNLYVSGNKQFRIDYPTDTTKYLQHACIESNKVLNKYVGKVITDNNSVAVVTLPEYFHDININFHYQLTVIGEFAQAIISKEIENGKFEIKTDKPNIKVSWEVTAERNDKYMRENPFQDIINK